MNGFDLLISLVLDWVVEKGIVMVIFSGNLGLGLWIVGFLGIVGKVILVGVFVFLIIV